MKIIVDRSRYQDYSSFMTNTETAKFETRAVLAGAYVKLDKCLTHVVEVDSKGWEIRVLCRKVKLENICDAGAENPDGVATCPVCAKRDPRVR